MLFEMPQPLGREGEVMRTAFRPFMLPGAGLGPSRRVLTDSGGLAPRKVTRRTVVRAVRLFGAPPSLARTPEKSFTGAADGPSLQESRLIRDTKPVWENRR